MFFEKVFSIENFKRLLFSVGRRNDKNIGSCRDWLLSEYGAGENGDFGLFFALISGSASLIAWF